MCDTIVLCYEQGSAHSSAYISCCSQRNPHECERMFHVFMLFICFSFNKYPGYWQTSSSSLLLFFSDWVSECIENGSVVVVLTHFLIYQDWIAEGTTCYFLICYTWTLTHFRRISIWFFCGALFSNCIVIYISPFLFLVLSSWELQNLGFWFWFDKRSFFFWLITSSYNV